MTARNMKKSLIIPCVICFLMPLLFCLTSCLSDMYRKRMLDYYEDDSVYVELTGVVKEKGSFNNLTIEVTNSSADFYMYSMEIGDFMLYSNAEILVNIEENDTIVFISAPQQFYDGHIWPIVALKKGEQELLSFEEGKNSYLKWIKEDFR